MVFHASDQWRPPIAPFGKAAAAMSQKVSITFHNSVSSSSENASLRAQLAAKERHIQHLMSLIPPSSSAATAASGAQPDPATVEDSDASAGSDDSIESLAFELLWLFWQFLVRGSSLGN